MSNEEFNFQTVMDEAIEFLSEIEQKLSKQKLPDGTERTPEQISYAAPIILQVTYKEWFDREIQKSIEGMRESLQTIEDLMPR